jgi:hypothetical protein
MQFQIASAQIMLNPDYAIGSFRIFLKEVFLPPRFQDRQDLVYSEKRLSWSSLGLGGGNL